MQAKAYGIDRTCATEAGSLVANTPIIAFYGGTKTDHRGCLSAQFLILPRSLLVIVLRKRGRLHNLFRCYLPPTFLWEANRHSASSSRSPVWGVHRGKDKSCPVLGSFDLNIEPIAVFASGLCWQTTVRSRVEEFGSFSARRGGGGSSPIFITNPCGHGRVAFRCRTQGWHSGVSSRSRG